VLWRHLVSACEVKVRLIECWQYLGAVCLWQPLGKKPVVSVVGCCPAWQRRH